MSIKETLSGLITLRPLRARLRAGHRRRTLDRAIRSLLADPAPLFDPTSDVYERLMYGWDNRAYCAEPEFLVASLEAARDSDGDILECGSGLSTLLLGVVAARYDKRVWSLEHHLQWAQRVRSALAGYGLDRVTVDVAPLRRHADFDWYAPDINVMPKAFHVALCDGPPGDTRGGRYGFLPVMRQYLAAGCTIILDDASRASERDTAERWARELGADVEIRGTTFPYAVIRTAADSAP